eukprot:1195534-Prorocentrum_minimum.AAC.4
MYPSHTTAESEAIAVAIDAPARDGEANEAIVAFLANVLSVKKGKVILLRPLSVRKFPQVNGKRFILTF